MFSLVSRISVRAPSGDLRFGIGSSPGPDAPGDPMRGRVTGPGEKKGTVNVAFDDLTSQWSMVSSQLSRTKPSPDTVCDSDTDIGANCVSLL